MKSKEIGRCWWNFGFLNLFLEKGAIHGLPYVGQKRLTVLERVIWLILTLVALCFSVNLALESLDRFKTKSTVISIERDYHYWNTTLPSVTICPMKRLNRDKFDAYYKNFNFTEKIKTDLFAFWESLANSSYFNFDKITEFPDVNLTIDPKDYMLLIYNLTDNYLTSSMNRSRVHAVADSLAIHSQQVLTEWGICYTTNNFLGENLSTSNLLFGKPAEANPYEATENVYNTLSMNIFDGESMLNFMGFMGQIEAFVHSAFEVMSVEKRRGSNGIPFECTVKVYDIIATEDFRKSTTIDQRQCRFPQESNLKHFPIYTRNLCHQECRINLAYKLCKCIPHFFPNRENIKPVCHYKVLKDCLFKYARVFENLNEIESLSLDNDAIDCNCLPNCRSSEMLEKVWKPLTQSDDLLISNGILVMMKTYPHIRYQRQIIFTLTDLLVSIGGTAGFFLGSSVLSAVEIFYYFTVRLIWHCLGYRE